MSRAAPFTQADAKRLIAAAKSAGLTVYGVETHNGALRVLTRPPSNDDVSPLAAWERKHGIGAA